MVRWREKGRRGGRQAGGNERLYPLTISAVTGLPAPEGEGGGGKLVECQGRGRCQLPCTKGAGEGSSQKTERQILVVMSEMEHLPSKDFAKWHRGPEPECQFSL